MHSPLRLLFWALLSICSSLASVRAENVAPDDQNYATPAEEALINDGYIFFPPKKIMSRAPRGGPASKNNSYSSEQSQEIAQALRTLGLPPPDSLAIEAPRDEVQNKLESQGLQPQGESNVAGTGETPAASTEALTPPPPPPPYVRKAAVEPSETSDFAEVPTSEPNVTLADTPQNNAPGLIQQQLVTIETQQPNLVLERATGSVADEVRVPETETFEPVEDLEQTFGTASVPQDTIKKDTLGHALTPTPDDVPKIVVGRPQTDSPTVVELPITTADALAVADSKESPREVGPQDDPISALKNLKTISADTGKYANTAQELPNLSDVSVCETNRGT